MYASQHEVGFEISGCPRDHRSRSLDEALTAKRWLVSKMSRSTWLTMLVLSCRGSSFSSSPSCTSALESGISCERLAVSHWRQHLTGRYLYMYIMLTFPSDPSQHSGISKPPLRRSSKGHCSPSWAIQASL